MKLKRNPDAAKHEAILKAATRLFLKRGYASTSMDAVALAARVTKQTVYAHYHNKDELFTQMVAALCKKHTPPSTALADNEKPVDALLYDIGLGFLNMITSKEGLAATRLVVAEATRNPKLAQGFYQSGIERMIHMLAQFLKQQMSRGVLRIAHPETAAMYFFAMLKGRYHLRMVLSVKPVPSVREKEKHVRETVRLFMQLYGK